MESDPISEFPETLCRSVRAIRGQRGDIPEDLFKSLLNGVYQFLRENDSTLSEETAQKLFQFFQDRGLKSKTQLMNAKKERLVRKAEAMDFEEGKIEVIEKVILVFQTDPKHFAPRSQQPGSDESMTTGRFIDASEELQLKNEASKTKLSDRKSSLKFCMSFSFARNPLSIEATSDGQYMAKWNEKHFGSNIIGVLTEGSYTDDKMSKPAHVHSVGVGVTANTAFPTLYYERRYVVPNPGCKPELALRVKEDIQGAPAPPLSVEWKTYPEAGIEELLQASTGALQMAYFPTTGQSWIFYEQPPYGLGTLYCGPTAIAVFAYEMVGYLIFSIYDSGSSLGTLKHEETMSKRLSNEETWLGPPAVNLAAHEASFKVCDIVERKARWSLKSIGGKFYKILRYDRFHGLNGGGECWRNLYQVYKRYGTIKKLPPSLVQARLLYGEYQVAVEMDFCDKFITDPWERQLDEREREQLMSAIVALASVGLCYTDFRTSNVLVSDDGGDLRLVDYDDMTVHDAEEEVKKAYHAVLAELTDVDGFKGSVRSVLEEILAKWEEKVSFLLQ